MYLTGPSLVFALIALASASVARAVTTPDLRARQLTAGQVPGLVPAMRFGLQPSLVSDPQLWINTHPSPVGEVAAAVARLHQLGFVAGSDETMLLTDGGQGVSVLMQLGSHPSATAVAATFLPRSGTFPVPGIPGARGYTAISGDQTAVRVVFSLGSYTYAVMFGFYSSVYNATGRAGVIAIAHALYTKGRTFPTG
jgi:hypothetical protein